MKTGAKIAIGCGVAVVLAVSAMVAGVVGVAFWGKQKLEEATGGGLQKLAEDQEKIQRYQAEANRNAFESPADGLIAEERLLKFLAVRRDVFGVYETHRAEIEAFGKGDHKPDLAAVGKTVHLVNELRLTLAKAQAREGLSDAEYGWLVGQVYKAAWATGVAKGTGGKQPSEAIREVADKAAEELRRQLRDNPNLTPEQRRQLEESVAKAAQQGQAAGEAGRSLDVPQANLELFERHREEIQKYAMNGLELLGL